MSSIEQIKKDLLVWAGIHMGKKNISEEAMPRFYEIIDQLDTVDQAEDAPHEHRFQVTASGDTLVRWCACGMSHVLYKAPGATYWERIRETS